RRGSSRSEENSADRILKTRKIDEQAIGKGSTDHSRAPVGQHSDVSRNLTNSRMAGHKWSWRLCLRHCLRCSDAALSWFAHRRTARTARTRGDVEPCL